MKLLNSEIVTKLEQLANLLAIDNANPFRIRAYRNAARTIKNLNHEVIDLIKANKDLTEIPGIGEDLANKITTIATTGTVDLLEELKTKIPIDLQLIDIPGLGPERVKQLYQKLKIKNIAELKKALKNGSVAKLAGFGEKVQKNILASLTKFEAVKAQKIIIYEAEKIAERILIYLKKCPEINNIAIAGSLRRKKDLIGDIDILATAKNATKAIEYFTKYENAAAIISKGTTRSSIKLTSGLQIDLRIIAEESFGAALQYFTGSKDHNIALRTIANQKKLTLNEYGVFKNDKNIASKTETQIYKCLGLKYIEPELRENNGEIEAGKNNKLPKLITIKDIRGDLHAHTKATDGKDTIETLAKAAQNLGYEYLAITDHTKHTTIANGLNEKEILTQIKQIDKINAKLKNFRILKSAEIDILEDGSLDLENYVLQQLDLTVCAIHYKFNLSRTKQTNRVLKAMENPYFNILAHPTGRLLNKRSPIEIDLEKIMLQAKQINCILELNSQPDRLDMNDIYCRLTKEIGVKVAISTDAHSAQSLHFIQYGINQARRGWLEAKDVINTYKLGKLQKLLKRR